MEDQKIEKAIAAFEEGKLSLKELKCILGGGEDAQPGNGTPNPSDPFIKTVDVI